ncbi:NAD(P)H-hydrate dehydratase [Cellulomonas massiliensis]|uniref:NAD(P)H-hydrate dehydratase n=1 Tax=Cellulomonas massiliensis TaxID=1465811 RepID=UPI0002D5A67C|nr:NAD(P)H-hydrate dehydratase [Cellulomonas massiliensis]
MGAEVLTPAFLRDWPLPERTGSKDERGGVLVVGGAAATPGAAMLTGLAALRAGAGRLTLAVAASVAGAVAVAVPESGVLALPESDGQPTGELPARADEELGRTDAVVVGPGLGDPASATAVVEAVAAALDPTTPVLLDAFALGVLPHVSEAARERLRGRLVLTPNHAEAERLLEGDAAEDDEDDDGGEDGTAATAHRIARRYGAVVALSGVVAEPQGRTWTSAGGASGLGTSGSGDVLAGAVGGLLAGRVPLDQAACWGVALHTTAGDRLAAAVGPLGFLARELVDEIPKVLVELRTR